MLHRVVRHRKSRARRSDVLLFVDVVLNIDTLTMRIWTFYVLTCLSDEEWFVLAPALAAAEA